MFIFRWLLYLFLFSILATFAVGLVMVSIAAVLVLPILVLIL